MNRLLCHGILLAQRGRLDSLSSGFRGRRARFDTQDIVTVLMVLAGIAVAIFAISYFLGLQEQRQGRASPLRLFLALCKAHRLRWSESWLLWRVARSQRLRDPARLFLEPQRLQAANLDRSFQKRQAKLIEIRNRLFDWTNLDRRRSESEAPQVSDLVSDDTPLSPEPPSPVLNVIAPPPTSAPDAGTTTAGSLWLPGEKL